MKVRNLLALASVVPVTLACGVHDTPRPGGYTHTAEVPENVASMVPEDAFPAARALADSCSQQEISACFQLAGLLEHGADAPQAAAGHGGDHAGQEVHGDDHAHAEDDHGDDHAHGEDDHAHAEDDHAHGEDDHGDDAHGDDHGHHGESYVGVEPNPVAALSLYATACAAGWQDACTAQARLSLDGVGESTASEVAALLAEACRQNNVEACHLFASAAEAGQIEAAEAQIVAMLDRACTLGSTEACLAQVGDNSITGATPVAADPNPAQVEVLGNGEAFEVRIFTDNGQLAAALEESARSVFGDDVVVNRQPAAGPSDERWAQDAPALFRLAAALGGDARVELRANTLSATGQVDAAREAAFEAAFGRIGDSRQLQIALNESATTGAETATP